MTHEDAVKIVTEVAPQYTVAPFDESADYVLKINHTAYDLRTLDEDLLRRCLANPH